MRILPLTMARWQVAEQALATFDFGADTLEGASPWEFTTPCIAFCRTLYASRADALDEWPARVQFIVRFASFESAEIVEVQAHVASSDTMGF